MGRSIGVIQLDPTSYEQRTTAELALWAGVLEQAIKDARYNARAVTDHRQEYHEGEMAKAKRDAMKWLKRDWDGEGTFRSVCEILRLDVEKTRAVILGRLSGRIGWGTERYVAPGQMKKEAFAALGPDGMWFCRMCGQDKPKYEFPSSCQTYCSHCKGALKSRQNRAYRETKRDVSVTKVNAERGVEHVMRKRGRPAISP